MKDENVAVLCFVVATIAVFSAGGVQSCVDGDRELRRLQDRCKAVGGTITGTIDTPDKDKPCVVGDRPVF